MSIKFADSMLVGEFVNYPHRAWGAILQFPISVFRSLDTGDICNYNQDTIEEIRGVDNFFDLGLDCRR